LTGLPKRNFVKMPRSMALKKRCRRADPNARNVWNNDMHETTFKARAAPWLE
jgi:hypothetical protein